MCRKVFLIFVFFTLAALLLNNGNADNRIISHFFPGQEWSIKSNVPTTAKVIIGRVGKWNGKIAVHVSIVDIPIPKGVPGAGGVTRIGHVAFEESTLEESVDRLIATHAPLPASFESGYSQWRAQQGDLTQSSVLQVIEYGLDAMRNVQESE